MLLGYAGNSEVCQLLVAKVQSVVAVEVERPIFILAVEFFTVDVGCTAIFRVSFGRDSVAQLRFLGCGFGGGIGRFLRDGWERFVRCLSDLLPCFVGIDA